MPSRARPGQKSHWRARERLSSGTFAAARGHTRIPYNHVDADADADGVRIGWWTTGQRTKRREGSLTPEGVAVLEAIDGWGWGQFELARAAGLAALNYYANAHGTASVPQGHVTR